VPPPSSYLCSSLHGQPSAGAFQLPGDYPALLLEKPCGALQQTESCFPLVPDPFASRKSGTAHDLFPSAFQYVISVVHGSYLL